MPRKLKDNKKDTSNSNIAQLKIEAWAFYTVGPVRLIVGLGLGYIGSWLAHGSWEEFDPLSAPHSIMDGQRSLFF